MIEKEEYEKLMATLERIEKAGTLADIVRTAPDPSWEDTALTMPTIYGEKRISQRIPAEVVCENFGRDEQECKDGIDNLLDESDNEVDNNININGGE